ncbi:MAG: PhoH family protein [Lachnospiraceae bacterium]|nr:PhoH family protein [Lachnospiraceae bacterium]
MTIETLMQTDAEHIRNVFGQYDIFAKKIEKRYGVSLVLRDGRIQIGGGKRAVARAKTVLNELLQLSLSGTMIEEQKVDYIMDMEDKGISVSIREVEEDLICHTVQGRPVKPKTLGQKQYVDAIRDRMIVFGIGPAGTGKTYLAMAMAITAFKREEVSRIILTRPAIEAGEKLGFLPGDLQSKVDPYLRPLYDALYQIMGAESFLKNMEKGLIEVAPLAYMRGRTLDNAYIILDEAQNTTQAQMKMFLTRIGFGSKVVITGDKTQKDLAEGTVSGLDMAERVLKGIDEISFQYLSSLDVVRHPLVQRIVKAYEDYESLHNNGSGHNRELHNRELHNRGASAFKADGRADAAKKRRNEGPVAKADGKADTVRSHSNERAHAFKTGSKIDIKKGHRSKGATYDPERNGKLNRGRFHGGSKTRKKGR